MIVGLVGLVGLVDELTSLRVDKLIVDLVGLVDELTAINLLTRQLVNSSTK